MPDARNVVNLRAEPLNVGIGLVERLVIHFEEVCLFGQVGDVLAFKLELLPEFYRRVSLRGQKHTDNAQLLLDSSILLLELHHCRHEGEKRTLMK